MTNLPANIPRLLRDAGLEVVVIDGWQGRERPGSFSPVGVLNHHTGASARGWDRVKELAYAKWMFLVGRPPGLPAPLVQIALGRSGTVYIGAAGRSNHAGTAKASGSVAAGDGNTLYVGIEWMLSGTEEIPAKMMAAGVTVNAVLTEKVTDGGRGTSVQTISLHYQTSVTGKWDIGDPNGIDFHGAKVLDVAKFRKAVAERREALYSPPRKRLPKIPAKGLVLPKGPSDHKPFVKDFWLSRSGKSKFRGAGWNVHHGTNAERAEQMFRRFKRLGVSLIMLNEAKPKHLAPLRELGYEVAYNDPEFAIAWLPGIFREKRDRDLVMSEHDYWLKRNEALLVLLEHIPSGLSFKAISEHPPAHISRRNHATFNNVLQVHLDVAEKNLRLAERSEVPVLIYRDSNIDPIKDRPVYGGSWAWAYRGYRYVRAPEPTFGKRHIDEFEVDGLRVRRFID